MNLEIDKRQYFHSPEPFSLESGGCLEDLTIAYHTYGRLNSTRDNVVWVCHALTANSDVADWWPHTVEKKAFLDPGRYFIVCANILGSHYGTTGPLSINPATGEPYYGDFPALTIRDMMRAHKLLSENLGIDRIFALVGSSLGGFQALEWAAEEPGRFDRLVLIATDAKASPWGIAIDESQRMAILADPTFGQRRPDAGMKGLAAARSLALLSYRGPQGYNRSQQDPEGFNPLNPEHRAVTYQRHQGEKLCKRYNAYSYMTILNAFDTHDIGRDRNGTEAALQSIDIPAIVVGITTDIIFTPDEMRLLTQRLPRARYAEIQSPFGHDGFLVEHERLNDILIPFMTGEISGL